MMDDRTKKYFITMGRRQGKTEMMRQFEEIGKSLGEGFEEGITKVMNTKHQPYIKIRPIDIEYGNSIIPNELTEEISKIAEKEHINMLNDKHHNLSNTPPKYDSNRDQHVRPAKIRYDGIPETDIRWTIESIDIEHGKSYDCSNKIRIHASGYVTPSFMKNPVDISNLAYRLLNGVPTNDSIPKIKDVIFNPPATIVFWEDDTKTVVKAQNEEFDPEKGIAMAYFRKCHGDKYEYYDIIRKYVGRYEKKQKKNKK